MRVVFMGTPELAARILEQLAGAHEVVATYTRPDAVRGRGRKLVPSPVKEAALALGIPVLTPPSLKDDGAQRELAALAPDVICVAAYGALLPKAVLECAPYGCLNVHASLLPRWRGAAPMERAILAGDAETGVCIMQMEEGLDTGPFCLCGRIPLDGLALADVQRQTADLGADLLLQALAALEAGGLSWTAQDEGQATYAQKIGKGELNPAPQEDTAAVLRKVRASSEAHPSKALVAGRPVALLAASPVSAQEAASLGSLEPGRAALRAKRLYLGCADGPLRIDTVKPDGKRAMDGAAFAAGIQGMAQEDKEWGSYEPR